jgi:hypothetical protein
LTWLAQPALLLAVSRVFSPAAARKCRSFSFDFAAKPQNQTNLTGFSAKKGSFSATGVYAPLRLRSGQASTGSVRAAIAWKKLFISVVLAALPPKQRKKKFSSMLPQAKEARCGMRNHADCGSHHTER